MKIPGMGCIALLLALSIFVLIVWLYLFVKPFYKWLNKKLDKPIYDERKNIVLEGPEYGKPQALHNILSLIPIIFTFTVISPLIFPYFDDNYIVLLTLLGITIPPTFLYYRDNIFIYPKKVTLEDGTVKFIHFRPEGYSFRWYVMPHIVNMFCCMVYGVSNYYFNGNINVIFLIIVCLIMELMIIFIEKTDKIFPLDLKTENGYTAFAITVFLVTIVLVIILYT